MAASDTVVVAMSGGVDSSVAAALLLEQGYQVIGLMARLWAASGPVENRCCTPDAVASARQVADQLGIPFYVRDYRDAFKPTVVGYFTATYAAGRTPNPCVVCNEQIRFGRLLDEALALGARYLATGHYARVQCTAGGELQLLKGADVSKDQSYVLHRLTQAQLAHVLFPLGGFCKPETRQVAQRLGLPVWDRPDSQDLCFLGDGDYRAFLARFAPEAMRPGPLLDTCGNVLGEHRGLPCYTIGQRKGLGLTRPQPTYVVQLDSARNIVVVGGADELGSDELVACRVNYVSGRAPASPIDVAARIRYQASEVSATLTCLPGERAHLKFDRSLRDITPGQAAVFYRDEVLLGGGFIA